MEDTIKNGLIVFAVLGYYSWIICILVCIDMIIFMTFLIFFVAMIIWGYWMYEIEIPPIPETEQEKHVRLMKIASMMQS